MRKREYGYQPYRGRGGNRALKTVTLLLVLVLIGVAAAVVVSQRYVVIDDQGNAHLEMPFLHKAEEEKTFPEETDPPIVVTTPSPPPGPEQDEIRPIWLEREALYDGSASELVREGKANAALFDMKEDGGRLGFVSQLPLAVDTQMSQGEPALNVAMKSIADSEEVYRVARISCFKDHALPIYSPRLAILTNSGYLWQDPEQICWTSPTSAEVRDYLTGLCVELSQLGFDEILLDNAGYPTRGNLHYIRRGEAYDETQFEAIISGFYAQVAEALKDTDTRLSVVYDPETTALSGQSEEGILAAGAVPVVQNEAGELLWPQAAAELQTPPEPAAAE